MDYFGNKTQKIAKRWGSALRPPCLRLMGTSLPDPSHWNYSLMQMIGLFWQNEAYILSFLPPFPLFQKTFPRHR